MFKATFLLLGALMSTCAGAANSEGEQLFVDGTKLFRASPPNRNPILGLAKIKESAAKGYTFAPYGLCIALSIEPEVLNFEESYAWCAVGSERNNRFAELAARHAIEVLGRITVNQGMDAVRSAKARATRYKAEFRDVP